jgi:hypothetical protein
MLVNYNRIKKLDACQLIIFEEKYMKSTLKSLLEFFIFHFFRK